MSEALTIEEWDEAHPRWNSLLQVVAAQDQARWVAMRADWHLSIHVLVARQGVRIVGFLRFVTQIIGADEDHEPVTLDGVALTEAKVLAFGVVEEHRRQGIGRALQERALEYAARLGCYQVRSHISGEHAANQGLKLAMGFGVHPVVRGDDRCGVYFVMPLKQLPDRRTT
jgi:GNAT superfamily N-acetyltransferase